MNPEGYAKIYHTYGPFDDGGFIKNLQEQLVQDPKHRKLLQEGQLRS
jgi:hypothetical protein